MSTTTTNDVQSVIENRRQILDSAEMLLRHEAEGNILNSAELSVLEAAGIDSESEHNSQLSRMSRVLRWETEAGTETEREKLRKEVKKAEKERDSKLPELRKQLEEVVARLEGEIEGLTEAVDVPTKKLEQMCLACEQLRSARVLPKHVLTEYNHRKSRVRGNFNEVPTMEARSKGIAGQLEILEKANEVARPFQDLAGLHKLYDFDEYGRKHLNQQRRAALIEKLKAEQAEIDSVYEDAKRQRDEALAEVEAIRDFYIK